MNKHIAIIAGAALALALGAGQAQAADPVKKIELNDPSGDDKGPGTYQYPTHEVYVRGSFDLRSLEISDVGDSIEFKVTVGTRVTDPWKSKDWDGNGFSLQFVQIYIDTDHKAGSGHVKPLPGLGSATFAADQAWDKLVVISPQGNMRLSAEIRHKAKDMHKDVIIPKTTRARGKTLIAVVKKSDLGQMDKNWGVQAVMQSNEGYPSGTDVLTRRVNEVRGEHRFGGGNDGECDPHILDIFAGAGKGEASEAAAQYAALAYKCGSKVAQIPMVYPFATR